MNVRNPPPISITLHKGQIVPWPGAPDGVAQVDELLTRNVVIIYARRGRLCRAKVPATRLAELVEREPLLIEADNLFARGIVPRAKRYALQPAAR